MLSVRTALAAGLLAMAFSAFSAAPAGAGWTRPHALPIGQPYPALNDRGDIAVIGRPAGGGLAVVLRRGGPSRLLPVSGVPATADLAGVDIGPRGELALMWSYDDGTESNIEGGAGCCDRVVAVSRTAAGRWGPRKLLGPRRRNTAPVGNFFDDDGLARSFWESESGVLGTASARPGGRLRRDQVLTRHSLVTIAATVGQGASVATITWLELTADERKAIRTASAGNGHAFGPARTLAVVPEYGPFGEGQAVGVGPDGGQTIAALRRRGTRHDELTIAVAAPGGRASRPIVYRRTRADAISDLDVLRDQGGRALLVWAEAAGHGRYRLLAAFGTGTSFGRPVVLQRSEPEGFGTPAATLDSRGRAIVAWVVRHGDEGGRVRVAVAPAGHRFGAAHDLTSTVPDAADPALVQNARGLVALTWTQRDGARLATYRFR